MILTLSGAVALAQSVSLVGIYGGSKAVLILGNGVPRMLAPGESAEGIRLLEIGRDEVRVEVAGAVRWIKLGDTRHHAAAKEPHSVTLMADRRGHFGGEGAINGARVFFLVDTGATAVTLDLATAQRIGLDLEHAEQGIAGTANGTVQTLNVTLDRVSLGGVSLRNVTAMVVQGSLPAVLLGESFLNRMAMLREGSTMVLKQRY